MCKCLYWHLEKKKIGLRSPGLVQSPLLGFLSTKAKELFFLSISVPTPYPPPPPPLHPPGPGVFAPAICGYFLLIPKRNVLCLSPLNTKALVFHRCEYHICVAPYYFTLWRSCWREPVDRKRTWHIWKKMGGGGWHLQPREKYEIAKVINE